MTLEPSLSSSVVTLGFRQAPKRALEGPIFGSLSDLESLAHGIVDAEMIGSGCICVLDTHTEALDVSGTLLVFVNKCTAIIRSAFAELELELIQ